MPNEEEITKAIYKILSKPFRNSIKFEENPYGDGKAAKRIVKIIEDEELPVNLKELYRFMIKQTISKKTTIKEAMLL